MPLAVCSPDEKSASDLPGPPHPVKPFGEAGPSGPPPARPSPAAARLFGIIAKDSVPPAGGSRGSPFFRGGKNQSISPSNAICPAYQKTGQPSLVARFLTIWVYSHVTYQQLPLLLRVTGHCPVLTAHCSLLIAHCQLSIRPQKKVPGAGPRTYRICNTVCMDGGLCRGKVSPGEAWRDRPLLKRRVSPRSCPPVGILRDGSLQGLFLRWES